MNLESLLAGVAPRNWVTRQALVLDWNKGPRVGVCALSQPGCEFFFHLSAESLAADPLDIRLFAMNELRRHTVDQIVELLHELGRPSGPLWVPVWKFRNDSTRQDVEGCLDALLVTARPTALLTATADLLHFDGCWNAEMLPGVARLSSWERK